MKVYLRERTCDAFSLLYLITSAGVWLLLNDVLALLFSVFYVIREFDGSYMEDKLMCLKWGLPNV